MRDRPAVAILVAVWLLSVLIWLRPGITRPDGVGYFAYLPSTYFDHDLVLFNEWQHFGMLPDGMIASEGLTPNGHLADHWTVGSAVVWYPAVIVADILRAAAPPLRRFLRDGISLPYNAAAVSASAVCGLIALLTGFAIARRFFTPSAALLATIGTWFGSSLMWYSTREALMAHAASAAACALVVLASLEDEWLGAGVAAGLAFSIRPQNATFIAVPFLIAALPAFRHWLVIIGGFIAGALPQLVVTVVLYGNPLILFNIAPGNAQRPWHSFEQFWPWQPIFSWYHGLGTWTPLMLLAIVGLPLLVRAHRGIGAAAILMVIAQWLANATLDRFFWAGSSFGQRRFDNCTIFFLLGLAAIFQFIPKWLSVLITAAGSIWTLALFFAAQTIDLNRYYAPEELLAAALKLPKRIDLLEVVPTDFKLAVLMTFVAVAVVYGIVAVAMRRRPGLVAAIFCVVLAGWFAICGANDASRMNEWSNVIARNRAFEPNSGAVRDRLALLRDEEDYLRRTGNANAAEATRRDITALEKSIPSPKRGPAPAP